MMIDRGRSEPVAIRNGASRALECARRGCPARLDTHRVREADINPPGLAP